jgi:hypothetical protein
LPKAIHLRAPPSVPDIAAGHSKNLTLPEVGLIRHPQLGKSSVFSIDPSQDISEPAALHLFGENITMADGALSANGVTTYFRRAREKTVNWQTGD